MKTRQFTRRDCGIMLPQVMVMGVIISLFGLSLTELVKVLNRQNRILRVKSEMRKVETRVRLLLNNRENFDCDTAVSDCTVHANWILTAANKDLLENPNGAKNRRLYSPQVLGAKCPAAIPDCRIRITINTTIRQVTITYQGEEVAIKPIQFDYAPPFADAYGGIPCKNISGDPNRQGVFAGYTTQVDGSKVAKCIEAPSCAPGEVYKMDPATLLGRCIAMYSSEVACLDSQEVITSIPGFLENFEPASFGCVNRKISPDVGGL